MECDVLVNGSGAAGLTAALKSSHAGLSVIVIEKEAVIGGTTALSEGMIWVPLSSEAKEKGIADSRGAALTYLEAAAGTYCEPERAAAYVDGAAEMLDFVHAHSEARFSLSAYSIDYHQDLPGATKGARAFNPGLFDGRKLDRDFMRIREPLASTMILGGMTIASSDLPHVFAMRRSPRSALHMAGITARYLFDRLSGHARGTRIANGNGLIGALVLALKHREVSIQTNTRAVNLLRDGKRVTGALVSTGAAEQKIVARRAVILCCGGFPGSNALQQRYYPHVASGKRHHSLAPQTNIGDGLKLGTDAGGTLNEHLAEPAAWTPVSLVPQTEGPPIPYPHYIDRGKPGIIAVTRRGLRFTNEADVYHRFVPAMIAACKDDAEAAVWLIADHRAIRRYGLGAAPPAPGRLNRFLGNGYLKRGSTIAELAAKAGIDAKPLEQTIDSFNRHAISGEDPDFGKGKSVYNRANGDPKHMPNPCLAPLATPPFYAVQILPGDIATFIGLRTDGHARVLDVQGHAIPGLYTAGNDAASAMGGDYPAAGITIGSAMTFGYLAARHIAEGR
jgi:succinate dehydrogenase/fumarate reductase flavoprotein subunit